MNKSAQRVLFHESLIDALKEVVLSLGGTKRVAGQLWPEKTIDEAARRLADCLNSDRRERLDPEQVLWLLRQGRAEGCHAAMDFICREAGYAQPVPVDPESQKTQLVKTIQGAAETMRKAMEMLNRFEKL